MIVSWSDLPTQVEDNIDSIIGMPLDPGWVDKVNEIVRPFGGTYKQGVFYFSDEAHYNWFILRWA